MKIVASPLSSAKLKTMQHQNTASGNWYTLSLAEQLGNVGSEYERALKWRQRNDARFQNAFDRFLELLDLTVADKRYSFSRKRELLRLRETACAELTQTTDSTTTLSNYFYRFALLARKGIPARRARLA